MAERGWRKQLAVTRWIRSEKFETLVDIFLGLMDLAVLVVRGDKEKSVVVC